CTSGSDTPSLRYQSITQSYFCKAHGMLLLYDISSLSSFLSACHWIENVKTHGCLFCETSAKDGTNVVEVALHLAPEVKRTIGTGLGAGMDLSIATRTAPRCCRT
ncbi:RASEF protein, partial [Dyaphorophyia castanea]|nr:RASEF protein [Platysteira castanea]